MLSRKSLGLIALILIESFVITGLVIPQKSLSQFEQKIRRTILRFSSKPDVVLITLEATRADHLSCYGYHRSTTPNICRVANDGILFKNAYSSSPHTAVSIPSILTSKHPYKVSTYHHFHELETKNVLFKIFRQNGYEVFAFSNILGEQAWADFKVIKNSPPMIGRSIISHLMEPGPKFIWTHYRRNHLPYSPLSRHKGIYTNETGVDLSTVEEVIHTQGGKSNELIMRIKEEKDISREVKYIRNLYDESLKSSDYIVGKLMDQLKSKGLYKDTLIIISADHGEALGDHANYFCHRELYDETLHVPLIMKFPNKKYQGEVNSQVRSIDLFRTLKDFLNLKFKEKDHLDGISLIKVIKNEKSNLTVIAEWLESYAIRTVNYKYIFDTENDRKELYNLKEDPEEKHNIINDTRLPDGINRTLQEINECWDEFGEREPKVNETVKRQIMGKLKKLGYRG